MSQVRHDHTPQRKQLRKQRQRRRQKIWAGITSLLLALPLVSTWIMPAAADDALPQYLEINKSVSRSELEPGQEFVYTIQVKCQEADCENAVLTDQLPEELVGWEIQSVTTNASSPEVTHKTEWSQGGSTIDGTPTVVEPGTKVQVDFTTEVDPVKTPGLLGMPEAQNFEIHIQLKVPEDLAPGVYEATNTALVEADNSQPADDSADIKVEVEVILDADASKSWDPASATFSAGQESTITLGGKNTSNVPVDRLVVQDPSNASEGATELDANNPFTIVDFASFGDAQLPDGTQVTVDAYVLENNKWVWKTGLPADSPQLPEGVDAAGVGGLRFTYTNENGQIDIGAKAEIDIKVEQRAKHRNSGADLSKEETSVTNEVAVHVESDRDGESDEAKATAPHTIKPAEIGVEIAKNINPDRIAAGASTTAELVVNNGKEPVSELRIAEPADGTEFFTDEITFGGFTERIPYPAGATSGQVIYKLAGGGDQVVDFASGETPPSPQGKIIGFEIVFEGPDNAIAADATTEIVFAVNTTEDATGNDAVIKLPNTAQATATAKNGNEANASDSDDLEIIKPAVSVDVDKKVRPGAAATVGDKVTASLHTKANITDRAKLEKVTVEDAFGEKADDNFWNVFNLIGIAPTEIPADTGLTIQVQDAGGNWHELVVVGSEDSAFTYSLDEAAFAAALGNLDPALQPADLIGVRFEFDSEREGGFSNGTVLQPNPMFQVRGETRKDGDSITAEKDQVQTYQNVVVADAEGKSDGGNDLVDRDSDGVDAGVIEYETGPGLIHIHKAWSESQVSALSGHERNTYLTWRVAEGFDSVTISDPNGDHANPVNTVFEAFDLRRIQPIQASDDPFSNGWFLKYDTISEIKLFNGNEWVVVPAPAEGWVEDGTFAGYELSEAEVASTTGIQISLKENAAAREAATKVGDAFDPFAPPAGSGVGFGPANRSFVLDWQLRDRARTDDDKPGAWVTETEKYNLDELGDVRNTVGIEGKQDGETRRDSDSDDISIVDSNLNTKLSKAVAVNALPSDKESLEKGIIFVPEPGDTRPTAKWTLVAQNDSVSPATHLRVTDPVQCQNELDACNIASLNANPFDGVDGFDEPFDKFDITGLNFSAGIADQVDLDASKVFLLRYNEDTEEITTTEHTATEVNGLDADALADVVGYSVTFQAANAGAAGIGATITQANKFTITVDSELRVTPRGEAEPLRPGALETIHPENIAYAQSYNDILDVDPNGELARKNVTLSGGDINVDVSKAISPSEIVRPNPDVPVTVTLKANQGSDPRSTLSPNSVVLEDHVGSEEFWDAFNFTGLGEVNLPAGADRVQVDLYGAFGDEGNPSWVTGEPNAVAQVPASISEEDFANVTGIRFTFTRADGKLFDPTRPPAKNWNTTAKFGVELRETFRGDGGEIQFDETFENTVSAVSKRTDGINSDEKDTTAPITLSEGTQQIAVKKLTNDGVRHARAGEEVPFALSFKNTGTGYLTITELRDTLPDELIYLGTDPKFIKDDDGLLSDDVVTEVDGQEIIFTWPEDSNVMAPGETFTIEIPFELQPTRDKIINPMTVTTVEPLNACGHIDGGNNWSQPDGDNTCATTDYVEVTSAANLFSVKGVRGSLEDTEFGGAYRMINGEPRACSPNLTVDGTQYFRSPCIAHSEVGGSDDWVLHTQNAGTTPIYEMTMFDQLPTLGDQMLVAGNDRGSEFRPELLGMPQVGAPEGTQYTVEVTTSENACVGTWNSLLTGGEVCEQSGEEWHSAGDWSDWSAVTGIRVHLDFTGTSSGALQIGQAVDVTFQTSNVLQTDDSPQGAPASVNTDDVVAWNQFGLKYRDSERVKRSAPNKVGVHLRTSAIEVRKVVAGSATAYAPDSFVADVQCTVGDVELDMGDYVQVTLSNGNDYRTLIEGIPFSSVQDVECVVTEQGDLGSHGETSRSISPEGGVLVIKEPVAENTDSGPVVPENQQAVLTNTYDFTGLSVTKHVDTDATTGAFGPFDFELTCESALGDPVTLNADGATTLEFTLEDGETFTVEENLIPVGASCVLTETDDFFADGRIFTGDNVTANDDGTATIVPGTTVAEVDVYNGYDSGTLTVEKIVEGAGADLYGFGPFGFDAQCTYQGQELLNESFELEAGATKSFGIFPAGTECFVTETATGGATSTVLDPEDGTVQVIDSEDETENATVTATNTFDVGSLEIIKQVEGAGAELYGSGPFTAEVMCTWDRDGVEESIALANDGVVTLSEDNDYRAIIDDLLVGAHCEVVETATGGANATSIDPEDGVVTIPGLDEESQPQAAVVTLTNVFDLTSLDVVKELRGDLTATGADGPFEVELACLRDVDGESVPVDIPGGAVRELSAESDFLAHYADLPLGAECVVTEIEDGGAANTEITFGSGADQVSVTGKSLDVTLDDAESDYVVHVINTFDPDPVDPEDPDQPKPPTWLPRTGAEILTAIAVGLLLVLAGVGLFRARRADK